MTIKNNHKKGMLAILVAAILWSSGGVFIKLINLEAMQIAGLRAAFTLLTFLILFRKENFRFNKLTFMAAICYTGILTLFVAATKLTTAANAIFLQYTAPMYVLVLEPIMLGTKLRRINIVTLIVCFIGMALFFVDKINAGNMTGNLLALASGLTFAGFLLIMRKNRPEYQISSIFQGNILVLLICSFSLAHVHDPSAPDILMCAFLGVVQIGIAYGIFSYGLKHVEAIEASLLSIIEPVLNPVWVFIWYHEQPSVYAITGGIIILSTMAIRTVYTESRKRLTLN
ncbi:MAG: DMT family transporter [Ignavibacteria bacterium]|nr:DMT family transporter [Ignavibacteria bacterium]